MQCTIRTMLIIIMGIVQLTCLNSCTNRLPESVQLEHNKEPILEITIFINQEPFGPYRHRVVQADGMIVDRLISLEYPVSLSNPLPEGQQEEIRQILEAMTILSPQDPFGGTEVISISFLWHGEHYLLSFSEKNCPNELARLFDITNDAQFSSRSLEIPDYWKPCEDRDMTGIILPDASPLTSLPDEIRDEHGGNLFLIIWFDQPFSGSYNRLRLETDILEFSFLGYNNLVDYDHFIPERDRHCPGLVDETEVEEAQAILASLANIDPVTQPEGTRTITLGFPWEGDYRLLTFGNQNCPEGVQQLLEISEIAVGRLEGAFQNPCQEN